MEFNQNIVKRILAGVAQCGASSCAPKDEGFDHWSEHISGFQVQSPVRVHVGGN